MPTQSSIHFYLNWAKDRIDEMDATLASLSSKSARCKRMPEVKADQTLTDLRKKRDDFRDTIKKQSETNEAAWDGAKAQLKSEWSAFEAEVNKYVESFGKQVGQQQAIFKLQAAAQLKAWHEAVDKLGDSAKEFAAERRGEIDAAVKRMNADAAAAEEKLQKLSQAGAQSWSALTAALTETRAAFDGANQSAREAFKRASA